MSAYFVEKETVDGAIGAILHSGFFMSLEQATSLGRSLWLLNAVALEQRYEEQTAQDYLDTINTYVWQPQAQDRLVLIKALDCLVYQCSEGNVPKSDLYQWASGIADKMAGPALRKTQGYYAAPWGLDAEDRA